MSKATVLNQKAAHVKQLPTKLVENGSKGRERAIMLVVRSVAVVEFEYLLCLRVEHALPLAGLPSVVHGVFARPQHYNSSLSSKTYTLKSSLHGYNTFGLCAGFQSTQWSSTDCDNRHGGERDLRCQDRNASGSLAKPAQS